MSKSRSGAGVGVGMLRGAGDSITRNSKRFLGFWFLASWFQKCFMFSKDTRYILPKFHFMIFDRYEIHIQGF